MTPARKVWPELADWVDVGSNEPVYRVRTPTGELAYVRPDDGSAPLLDELGAQGIVPVPARLEVRDGWLLLSALPGAPLHDPVWRARPLEVAAIAADAQLRLVQAGVRHGDMCLPNILGDPETAALTGIVDWRYAGQFDREIDVASTVWSCGYNGYTPDVAVAVLEGCGWQPVDDVEVARLGAVWTELAGPAESPSEDMHGKRDP
jgi:aminoglycoside phosphotransferase